MATKADDLVAQLGTCVRALVASHGLALATLQPHLTNDALYCLEPDPHQLARAVLGRVMNACGFDTHSMAELTGTGMLEMLKQEPIRTVVGYQHRALMSRRPAAIAVPATDGVAA